MLNIIADSFKTPQYQDLEFINKLDQTVEKTKVSLAMKGIAPLSREDTMAYAVGGYINGVVEFLRATFPKPQADEIADARIRAILLQYPQALTSYKRCAELYGNMPATLKTCREVEETLAARNITHIHVANVGAADAAVAAAPTTHEDTDVKAPPPSTSGLCANRKKCGNMKNVVARCTGCKLVFYCGPGCQREHWKTHKIVCKK